MRLISNCRMHMDTLRRSYNRGQTTDEQLEAKHHEQFCDWYREYVQIINMYFNY
jgi:hypothetical protein